MKTGASLASDVAKTQTQVERRKLHQKLLRLVDQRYHTELYVICAMMLLMSALEVGCALLFVPFLSILESPQAVERYGWLEAGLGWAGLEGTQGAILGCCLLLLSGYIIKNAFNLYFQHRNAHFVRNSHALLARELLQKYLTSGYLYHVNRDSAALIRNINQDTNNVFNNVLRPALMVMVEGTILVGMLLLLLLKSPGITLLTATFFGVLSVGVYKLSQRATYAYGKEVRHTHGQMIRWTMQSLGSIKETKVMGKEGYFLGRFDRSMESYAMITARFAVMRETPRLFIEVLGMATVLLITLMLSRSGDSAEFLPTLGLFAVAAFRMLPSLSRISSSMTLVRFNQSSVDGLLTDLEADVERVALQDASDVARLPFEREIAFEEVWFAYSEGSADVLRGLSLQIGCGETVAFVGSSGAGKTTAVDLLLGLLNPSRGTISVDGQDIASDTARWQRQIGYISQPVYLLHDTIRRNVAFGLLDEAIDEARVWDALRRAQLEDVVRALPEGLDTEIGEGGVKLSGGQRQRLGIARVLYLDPPVLVFDEATSALDNETEREITRAIHELSESKTIILIAHRLNTIRDCDRIFVLNQGRVEASGTYDELLTTSPTFARLAQQDAESTS